MKSLASTLALAPLLGLAACNSKTAVPRCPVPPSAGKWNNAVQSVPDLAPELLAYPGTAATIVALVKVAEAQSKRIRMTGSGHSFSDVAMTDDMLLLPNRLSRMLALDGKRLRPQAATNRHLVRVQSGMTIHTLNEELDRAGLALQNLGGYDAQTIAGVAMTATHGSGLAFGPIASQIVSLQIVTAGGEVLQIEPTNGITDPRTFPGKLEEDETIPVRLVQDDRYFNAVGVSMGSMGIVYAVVVETVDKFWLREQRTMVSWAELSRPGGYLEAFVQRPRDRYFTDHLEVVVNPYPRSAGSEDHYCLLTQRQRLSTRPPVTKESQTRGALGDGHLLADPWIRGEAELGLVQALDGANPAELQTILTEFMRVIKDDDYTDASYRVFNIGEINKFRAYGIEMAFDLKQTIPATKTLFRIAAEELAQGRHHSVPVTLRFVKQSSSFLAMQYGRDTMTMEIGMLVVARGAEQLLKRYETQFIADFGARPHWGLDVSVLQGEEQAARLYPAWKEWKRIYLELNKTGVFNGRVTDRLGISVHPKPGLHHGLPQASYP